MHKIWYDLKDHNMAPKPWTSIPNIKIYLKTKFCPNRRMFLYWRPFWIKNGPHSKLTMDINSQHHNLLGNKISPKSEDFCIWRPFCALVTMETFAILNFFNHQKLPHTTVDINTKFHEVCRKEFKKKIKSPLLCFHGNCGNVCPTDSDFFCLSLSTKCGCCSYEVSSISVRRVTCYDHFYVFIFF